MMERTKIAMLCVQETKWKGKELGNGYKLYQQGSNGKRNGVGIILNKEVKSKVKEVRRKSDRIIHVRIFMMGK